MNGQGPGPSGEALPTQELYCLRGHDGPVLAVRFNTAGTYCLSCGKVSWVVCMRISTHGGPRLCNCLTSVTMLCIRTARSACGIPIGASPSKSTMVRSCLMFMSQGHAEYFDGHSPWLCCVRTWVRRPRCGGVEGQQQVRVVARGLPKCTCAQQCEERSFSQCTTWFQVCIMRRGPPGVPLGRQHRTRHPQVPRPRRRRQLCEAQIHNSV